MIKGGFIIKGSDKSRKEYIFDAIVHDKTTNCHHTYQHCYVNDLKKWRASFCLASIDNWHLFLLFYDLFNASIAHQLFFEFTFRGWQGYRCYFNAGRTGSQWLGCEVKAFDMHNKGKEVYEEKPKYGSVYLNDVLNLNIQQANSQTKTYKQERIDNFGDGDIARLGSLNSKCIKQSFS